MMMKTCRCGTRFSHPVADDCSLCGGRACAHCGRAKLATNETCGRTLCKRAASRARNVTVDQPRKAVLPYRHTTTGSRK